MFINKINQSEVIYHNDLVAFVKKCPEDFFSVNRNAFEKFKIGWIGQQWTSPRYVDEKGLIVDCNNVCFVPFFQFFYWCHYIESIVARANDDFIDFGHFFLEPVKFTERIFEKLIATQLRKKTTF